MLGPTRRPRLLPGLVAAGGGVLKGELHARRLRRHQAGERGRQAARSCWRDLDDADHVERYQAFEDWFKHTQDLPGDFYLWIVEHLFRDNELVRGRARGRRRRVDLAPDRLPALPAGRRDRPHHAAGPGLRAGGRHASTPQRDVTKRTTSGGHLGLFMGREALRDALAADPGEVLEHSRAGAPTADRRRSVRAAGRRERARRYQAPDQSADSLRLAPRGPAPSARGSPFAAAKAS